jgi:hypothetical protein
MKRSTPDAATLDALVLGTDEAGDQAAWEWLVVTPGSGDRWAEAVARHAEMDRFAAALMAHPWLALALARMRKLGRAVAAWRLEVVAVKDEEAWAASLGPSSEGPTLLARPSWGRLEPVTVGLGTIVELRPAGHPVQGVRFFYKSQQGEGSVPEGRWRLEPGEAPVMLVAREDGSSAGTLDEVFAGGAAVAGILLLEGPGEPR